MSEEHERLLAIAEHPEDRAPRRAYADWLLARGGPRAEYIRAVRRDRRLPRRDTRRRELFDRMMGLHRESQALLGFQFRSCREGLPGEIQIDAASYAADGRDPAFLATARKLTVAHPHAWPFALLASPWLGGVTDLTFLAEGPGYLTDGVGEAGAKALASALLEPRLTRLELGGNAIGDAGAAALAGSPGLGLLAELGLGGGGRTGYWCEHTPSNHIGDEGARAFADSPNLPALWRLDLDHNDIGDEGARALAASTAYPALKVLSLEDNRIGYPGAWALADSPLAARLNVLELANNRIGLRKSSICDWDGSIVGAQYDQDGHDPEWPLLRSSLGRFLGLDSPPTG